MNTSSWVLINTYKHINIHTHMQMQIFRNHIDTSFTGTNQQNECLHIHIPSSQHKTTCLKGEQPTCAVKTMDVVGFLFKPFHWRTLKKKRKKQKCIHSHPHTFSIYIHTHTPTLPPTNWMLLPSNFTHTHTHVYTHTHTHTCVYTHTHTHTHTHTYYVHTLLNFALHAYYLELIEDLEQTHRQYCSQEQGKSHKNHHNHP